ncbi:unnamed protein product [Didymodactylos carnosus]|uniref:Uncharacterized protein n=1 Tax=Didymodactylos carnosus TaxID=1234261 RepID=A0A814WBI4_9BILA|nr:unnamed protein product [Didymodactylos carnosus]CAF1199965.1 unnamed protein product [Didymodactylos carnosus]CAF3551452.1 unnamed protein product [Didymodactylos carnosus]CAF3964499.1 unnamed protein product [Didymodactylos carnosus]
MKTLEQKERLSGNVIRNNCQEKLKRLWESLNELKPCQAKHNDPTLVRSDWEAVCCQLKRAHKTHRISGTKRSALSGIVSPMIGLFWPILWDGNFENVDANEPGKQDIDRFVEMVMDYKEKLEPALPKTEYETFKNLLDEYKIDKSIRVFYSKLCPYCLAERKHSEIQGTLRMGLGISTPVCKQCNTELNTMTLMPSTTKAASN